MMNKDKMYETINGVSDIVKATMLTQGGMGMLVFDPSNKEDCRKLAEIFAMAADIKINDWINEEEGKTVYCIRDLKKSICDYAEYEDKEEFLEDILYRTNINATTLDSLVNTLEDFSNESEHISIAGYEIWVMEK